MSDGKKRKPTRLGEVVPEVLEQAGLSARMERAAVIVHWPTVVGREISKVTQAISIDARGLLTVAVSSSAWMTELSLMAPELVRALNAKAGSSQVAAIKWRLVR